MSDNISNKFQARRLKVISDKVVEILNMPAADPKAIAKRIISYVKNNKHIFIDIQRHIASYCVELGIRRYVPKALPQLQMLAANLESKLESN